MNRSTIILVLFASVLFASCEDKLVLKSKKTLDARIQNSWIPVQYTSSYGTSYYNKHLWKFTDGSLYILNANGNDTLDRGGYSIDAKAENSTLKISGLSSALIDTVYNFNTTWTLIQLDDNVLDIAGNNSGGALMEVEFVKKQ